MKHLLPLVVLFVATQVWAFDPAYDVTVVRDENPSDEEIEAHWRSLPPLQVGEQETRYRFTSIWGFSIVGEEMHASDVPSCTDVRKRALRAHQLGNEIARIEEEISRLSSIIRPNTKTTTRITAAQPKLAQLNSELTQTFPPSLDQPDRVIARFWSIDPRRLLALPASAMILDYKFTLTHIQGDDFAARGEDGMPDMGFLVPRGMFAGKNESADHAWVMYFRPVSPNLACIGQNALQADGNFEVRFRRSPEARDETREVPIRLLN